MQDGPSRPDLQDEAMSNAPAMSPRDRATTMEPLTTPQRIGPVRRLYHWVLSWAETKYGTPALATISFAESSVFPIPPDVLQIALSVSKPRWSYWYAFVSMLASVAGGVLGWVIGAVVWASVAWFFFSYIPGFSQAKFDWVASQYNANAFLAIVGAAFTPIPYKIFTIAAGACNVSIVTLIVASFVGRGARFFLVATAIFFFGERVKTLLEKYFELACILLFAALIGGFVAIKYLMH